MSGKILMILCGEDLFRREGAEDFEEVIMSDDLGVVIFISPVILPPSCP